MGIRGREEKFKKPTNLIPFAKKPRIAVRKRESLKRGRIRTS